MHWQSGICAALVLAGSCAWGQGESADQSAHTENKVVIGVISGLPRPDGFVVEDRRTDVLKTSARRQTYRREFRPFSFSNNRGPLAKYETNVGDAELNVSPVDFMAEQMVRRYGEKLNNKRFVLHRFSLTIKESIDKSQGVVAIPLDPASIGVAIVTSLAGTAIIRGTGSGRSLELEVKIEGELDGRQFTGSDFGSFFAGAADGRAEKIVAQTLKIGFYNLERAEAPEKDKIKPDSAVPPQIEASAGR